MKLLLQLLLAVIAAGDALLLSMQPGIVDPKCGDLSAATISVRYAPDEFYLSKKCLAFLNLIGGIKANKHVDVVFMCTSGQSTYGTGVNDNKMKLVFFTQSKGPDVGNGRASGTHNVGTVTEVIDQLKDIVLEIPMTVNGNWDAGKKATVFGSFTC